MVKKTNIFLYFIKRFFDLWKNLFTQYPPKIKRMDYDDYWVKKGSFGFTIRHQTLAKIIDTGASVLDIGCGDGATLRSLIDVRNVIGEGIDISNEGVKMAKAKGVEAFVGNIASPDFQITKEYDYIIISEVLEHISNPEEVMEKVKYKFKKLLIISSPNIGFYRHRLRLLFGQFPVQWAFHPSEHLRYWTVKDFKNWVNYLGFQIVGMRTCLGFLFLHKYIPNLFAESVIFSLKIKE